MPITCSRELFLKVGDGPGPIFQVNVISIQNKWDISLAFSTNPLVNYKINTCEWSLNLTDSGPESCPELPEVTGFSVFKQNPQCNWRRRQVLSEKGVWVPSSMWGLFCSAISSCLTQGSDQK